MQTRKAPHIKRDFGPLFNALGSHTKVDDFAFYMIEAYEHPDSYHPVVASIAEQWALRGRVSVKQVMYASHLLQRNKSSRGVIE